MARKTVAKNSRANIRRTVSKNSRANIRKTVAKRKRGGGKMNESYAKTRQKLRNLRMKTRGKFRK